MSDRKKIDVSKETYELLDEQRAPGQSFNGFFQEKFGEEQEAGSRA